MSENGMVRAIVAARGAFDQHGNDELLAVWRELEEGLLTQIRFSPGLSLRENERAAAMARVVRRVDAWDLTVPGRLLSDAMRAVVRAAHGVLVFRLADRCGCEDRDAFLTAAEEAFGGALDLMLHSRLLLAYRRLIWMHCSDRGEGYGVPARVPTPTTPTAPPAGSGPGQSGGPGQAGGPEGGPGQAPGGPGLAAFGSAPLR